MTAGTGDPNSCRDLGVRGVGLDLSHSYLDEQAKVRASVGAPSNALAGLPLFGGGTG